MRVANKDLFIYMAKNHEVRLKFDEEEYQKVLRKARELGMPVSAYLRTLGLISNISTNTPT
jgi:hypothetical protein